MPTEKTPKNKSESLHAAVAPLGRVTVSAPFWREVFVAFPKLKDNPAYRTFFWYLMFGGWHDEDNHRLLLCADIISSIEGRDSENTVAEVFLTKFREEVLAPVGGSIEWTGWFIEKCRQLRILRFGSFHETLLQERRGDWDSDGLVYLDGSRYSPKKQSKLRIEQQRQANRLKARCDQAEEIRSYLNSLPSNLFAGLLHRNFKSALQLALEIKNENVRQSQLRILRHIKSQPQPFYFPSAKGNTVRLSTSEGIPNLKSDIRRALTNGWYDADLRCSQLAICGHLWSIKAITDFLESGGNIWSHLCDSISLPPESRALAKPIVKKALYSICYGMKEGCVKGLAAWRFESEGLSKGSAWKLMSVPMVTTLLQARSKRLREVEQQGGASDCYDQWRPITQDRQPRDVLAEISQSWEMRLIAPAFKLARATDEFTIGLFQHDGFSVHFHKQTEVLRVDRCKRKIEDIINSNTKRLGIPTKIEWTSSINNNKQTDKSRAVNPFMSRHNGIYSGNHLPDFQKPSESETLS